MVILMQSKSTDWFNWILQCIVTQFDLSFRELHRNLRFFCLLPRIMYFCSSWLTETWHTKKLKWWAVTVFRTFRKIWTLSIVSNFIIKIAREKKNLTYKERDVLGAGQQNQNDVINYCFLLMHILWQINFLSNSKLLSFV